ncbi:MAG: Mur ligase domain-containing protein [bacterium]
MAKYFFVGIGGSGMSSLAQIVRSRGHAVAGSDRNYDRGINRSMFRTLRRYAVALYPQDGTGITNDVDRVIISTAIESTIPDVAKACALGIPVVRRAEVLAEIFNVSRGIAVGGTSGKSTTTGMIGWLLYCSGLEPTIVNGGEMKNFETVNPPGNAYAGKSDLFVIEGDESDGTIVLYNPAVVVITNIAKDHKTLPELRHLFSHFALRARECVIVNADCQETSGLDLHQKHKITFSITEESDIRANKINCRNLASDFYIDDSHFYLKVPGIHNVYNALAAVAACKSLGIETSLMADALADFSGIRRRFDIVGEAAGIPVIDDFAHNPDKIRATISTVAPMYKRLLLVYQPHGFGPTAFLKDELIETFSSVMRDEDILYMPEIYYAGGSASKTVSSRDLVEGIAASGRNAFFISHRGEIADLVASEAASGDAVVVMGARDPSLTDFCRRILKNISKNFV